VLTHLLFFLSSLVFTQYHPQEWGSITSLLTPTGIQVTNNGTLYASTSGGLLQFDPATEKFSAIKMEAGLVYLDLSTIEVDSKDRLWLGGSYPNGCLQVYDPDNWMVRKIAHLDIAQISKIQIGEDIAFAVYEGTTSSDIGILEFTLDSDGLPIYRDYYNNFVNGGSITDIWDLDIFLDSVFVTTEQGLFSGNYKEDNLKSAANWVNIVPSILAEQFVPANNPFIVTNSSILQRKNGSWDEYYTGFTSEPIQAELYNETIAVLTGLEYYEITEGILTYSFPIPVGNQMVITNVLGSELQTTFTSFVFGYNGNVLLGVQDFGIIILNYVSNNYKLFAPDTPFRNKFQAITITSDGKIAATSQLGTIFHNKGKNKNFIPVHYNNYYPDGSDNVGFYAATLQYKASEHFPISILEKDNGKLIFSNSGVFPSWGTAVIELDPVSHGLITYGDENDIIDQKPSGYMMVNQIEKDRQSNIWVTNPFCEKNGNMIAIQSADDDSWSHVRIPDSSSFRPQTLAFDNSRRAWLGFAYESNDNMLYSSGGIKVLKYDNLEFSNETDSTWLAIANPEMLPGGVQDASVWSLVFDQMDFLWILNENGIRAYTYLLNDNRLIIQPIFQYTDGTPIDILPQVSYTKGNRIKVDSQNNKWITTHQGVWVIKASMEVANPFWPSEEGLHPDNSGLLSDIVYDIAFDNDRGLAYIATDKGISILQIPFADNPSKAQSMYISPNPLIIPDDDGVIIKNIPSGSIIKIMTITGLLIKEISLPSNESQAIWDGTNSQGAIVGTAVYLVSAHHPSEQNKVSKIAVIRK